PRVGPADAAAPALAEAARHAQLAAQAFGVVGRRALDGEPVVDQETLPARQPVGLGERRLRAALETRPAQARVEMARAAQPVAMLVAGLQAQVVVGAPADAEPHAARRALLERHLDRPRH